MINDDSAVDVSQVNRSALRGSQISADRRRGQKISLNVATSEREYSEDEMAFMGAIEQYQRQTGKKYPTWTEVLGVVRELGYIKPM